jgi:hypothetical protein
VLANPPLSASLCGLVSSSAIAISGRRSSIAWLLPVIVLAAAVGACGAPDVASPIVFDRCQVTTLVAAVDATPDERAGIETAIALWASVGGPPLALAPVGAAQPAGQALPVIFQTAAPVFNGLYDPGRGDIFINRTVSEPRARAITVAHELGHAFGLVHDNERRSLMSPGNLVIPPGENEVRLINERRGSCGD